MDDLRQRFAALDRVVVPDLRPEVERRIASLAERPAAGAVRPRVGLGGGLVPRMGDMGGRRFASLPVLLLLALLIVALLTSLTIGAGWWEHRGVLVPPSTQPPRALVPTGDCPGAVRIDDDAPPFRGWFLGPEPGFLARVQPARITATWSDTVVEVDPLTRAMCRLLTPMQSESPRPLEWSRDGSALAIFRGREDFDIGSSECCPDGPLTVWWPGGHSQLATFDNDYHGVNWSNRGAWLAVTRGRPVQEWADTGPFVISLYPADGGTPRDLRFECEPCVVSAGAFSPNDARVAVTFWRVNDTKTDADELLAVADVASGSSVVLDVGPTNLRLLGWRDDETILAVDDGRRLLAVPVNAPPQFSVVAEFPLQLGVDGIWEEWSPDFSRVAFKRITGDGQLAKSDVFVLDVASGSMRQIVREAGDTGEFVWAPDNRTFTYTVDTTPDRPEQGLVLMVADALEGEPVAIAMGVTPTAWRPVWR